MIKQLLPVAFALAASAAYAGHCDNGMYVEDAGDVYINGRHAGTVSTAEYSEKCLNQAIGERDGINAALERMSQNSPAIKPEKKKEKTFLDYFLTIFDGSRHF